MQLLEHISSFGLKEKSKLFPSPTYEAEHQLLQFGRQGLRRLQAALDAAAFAAACSLGPADLSRQWTLLAQPGRSRVCGLIHGCLQERSGSTVSKARRDEDFEFDVGKTVPTGTYTEVRLAPG